MSEFLQQISSIFWGIFLPLIIIAGSGVIYGTIKLIRQSTFSPEPPWRLKKVKSALTISLSSKIGTGAIIGVMAAMSRLGAVGINGEALLLWVLIGMLLLVPLTYAEVFLSRLAEQTPREFISLVFNKKLGTVYILSLVMLYSFGFVGFQFSGIQSVFKIATKTIFHHQLTNYELVIFIMLPIFLTILIIVLTRSHQLFINVLGSLISSIILLYILFFIIFLFNTIHFIPQYFSLMLAGICQWHTVGIGIPIGLIIGFQRIIQISETALGTSSLSSSDGENSPRREALLQTIATIFTLFIAVVITSYVFSYGIQQLPEVTLSNSGFERIAGYLFTAQSVTGLFGIIVIIAFFMVSGITTILGSFHFVNVSLHCSEKRRSLVYMLLITTSGLISVANFDIIFDIVDMLMFIVSTIMIISLLKFLLLKPSRFLAQANIRLEDDEKNEKCRKRTEL